MNNLQKAAIRSYKFKQETRAAFLDIDLSFLQQCRKQEQLFLAMHAERNRINNLMAKFSRMNSLASRRCSIRFKAQSHFFFV